MPRPSKDLTGQRFGMLTAIKTVGVTGINRRRVWLVLCDCGKAKKTAVSNLVDGKARSCGCLKDKIHTDRLKTHGAFGTPEYRTWAGMLSRCRNKASKAYRHYGFRGIKVCSRWLRFENFLKDMGKRPSLKFSLDRINNNGDYEPNNCRWATAKQQVNNRRTKEEIKLWRENWEKELSK